MGRFFWSIRCLDLIILYSFLRWGELEEWFRAKVFFGEWNVFKESRFFR